MTVPGEANGGGIGLSGRKSGWMCDWFVLGRRRGGRGNAEGELVLGPGEVTGESAGEAGSGVASGVDGLCGKGPSRGFAGETGRLPGIGSSLLHVVFCTSWLGATSSTAEVSQVSKPSLWCVVSKDVGLSDGTLGMSVDAKEFLNSSLVLEVMGRRA